VAHQVVILLHLSPGYLLSNPIIIIILISPKHMDTITLELPWLFGVIQLWITLHPICGTSNNQQQQLL
jgi:hypothetical protein